MGGDGKVHAGVAREALWQVHRSGDYDIGAGAEGGNLAIVANQHRTLASIGIGMQQRTLMAGFTGEKRRFAAQRMPALWLAENHVRPEAGKEPCGPGAGQPVGQVHHTNPG